MRSTFVTILLLFVALSAFFWSTNDTPETNQPTDLQHDALMYMSQPKFSGDDFTQQLTGTRAELKMFAPQTGWVYMSHPRNYSNLKEVLPELVKDTSSIEYARRQNGHLKLSPYTYAESGEYFFRFQASNLKVEPGMTVRELFGGDLSYEVTLGELTGYLNKDVVYGGNDNIDIGQYGYLVANHAAYVTEGGEASLKRLTNQLTSPSMSSETKTQRLLDFVTGQISYDATDNIGPETLKYASSVLLTGGSDCTGKVILFASLLEQVGVEYVLVYMPQQAHIAVGVTGDFPNYNGYSFNWEGRQYMIAETTVDGFQIGRTRVSDESIYQYEFLQEPGGRVVTFR